MSYSGKSLTSGIRFSWMEFSGSLGDLGLFLPLVVAMTIACDLNIGVILILAGLMNVCTGFLFRQPIPVQPMKAIAAVVITEGLVQDELIAAGLLMGVILLLCSGIVDKINRYVPKPIVWGIQLGIGIKLALKGVEWVSGLTIIGWDSIICAVIVVGVLLLLANRKQPTLLYIFLFGFVILYLKQPDVFSSVSLSGPNFFWHWPSQTAWSGGLLKGALPQLPLTLLNSVVALCALSSKYFPGRGVQPRKITASIGLMNLFCVPLGGIPMCHGSGGLAAQHRFGARTGGSVILLGALKIIIGFLFGGALLELLQSYPMAILGPMLIFAGVELARPSKDVLSDKKGLTVAIITAIFILGINTLAGFLAGSSVSIAYLVYNRGGKGHGS